MSIDHDRRPFFQGRARLPGLFVIPLIFIVLSAACNAPVKQTEIARELTDPNARMYQMYFDSSSDPAQNELQVRRFKGHLHLADLEGLFGDIHSLPRDDNCNFAGGPVLDDGLIWYFTATPDLVGVNLVSVAPDGSMSSALDLDGDRVVDILDIGLVDNRRFTILSELNGLDVSKLWLQGQNPFCTTELVEQLDLPDLGCNETGDGSSGGEGLYPGSGIIDPLAMMCSEYDTSPWSGVMDTVTKGQIRSGGVYQTSILEPETYWNEESPRTYRHVETYVTRDVNTGQVVQIDKVITDVDTSIYPNQVISVTTEKVTPDGHGVRTVQQYNVDGSGTPNGPPTTAPFEVHPEDEGQENYDPESSDPPLTTPAAVAENPPASGGSKTNPGPEGDDSVIAEFCGRRANYRSGLEQAAEEDPTSMSVSCNDVVGDPDMPDDPNCTITQWARPQDFLGFLDPSAKAGGCDPSDNPDQMCEPESIGDRIRKVRGHTAELWSLGIPDSNLCPPQVCDPALATEQRTHTAGEVETGCTVIIEPPTLQPSAENCPPGTYYAPVTNRCIEIQIPEKKSGGGGGGSEGGGSSGGGSSGGGCNLSPGACSSIGTFDEDSCSCEPFY